MGWFVAFAIILGVVVGWWIDGLLGTVPFLTLLGALGGVIVAFYGVYRMVKPLLNLEDKKGNGST